MIKNPISDEAAAYHEAGHGVIALVTGNSIRERGLALNGEGGGTCHTRLMAHPLFIDDEWDNAHLVPDSDFARRHLKRRVYRDVIEFLAGWAAEHRWHGQDDPDQESWAYDILLGRDWEEREEGEALDDITQACWSIFTLGMLEPSSYDKTLSRFRHLQRMTHGLVAKHWTAIEATAEALMIRRMLSHEDVEQIFNMANTGTPWRLVKKRRDLVP